MTDDLFRSCIVKQGTLWPARQWSRDLRLLWRSLPACLYELFIMMIFCIYTTLHIYTEVPVYNREEKRTVFYLIIIRYYLRQTEVVEIFCMNTHFFFFFLQKLVSFLFIEHFTWFVNRFQRVFPMSGTVLFFTVGLLVQNNWFVRGLKLKPGKLLKHVQYDAHEECDHLMKWTTATSCLL